MALVRDIVRASPAADAVAWSRHRDAAPASTATIGSDLTLQIRRARWSPDEFKGALGRAIQSFERDTVFYKSFTELIAAAPAKSAVDD